MPCRPCCSPAPTATGSSAPADGGANWTRVEAGLTASVFRFVGPDPTRPGALLAGTEPARLFGSEDAGATWAEVEAVRVPGHEHWSLPYSPRAGALRNVYGPPGRPGHLLASVEVGGLLQSHDGGATCTVEPVIHDEDIHLVTGHPDDPDVLYTALGTAAITPLSAEDEAGLGGVARSRDGGRTWEKVIAASYTRAVLVPPARPDLVVAGPAPRVGREGRIVVSADGGATWDEASGGIDVPMPDMVQLFVPAPGRLGVGHLLARPPAPRRARRVDLGRDGRGPRGQRGGVRGALGGGGRRRGGRARGAHGVQAAVDVEDLARDGPGGVGEQEAHGLGHGLGVADVPAERGAALPQRGQVVEARGSPGRRPWPAGRRPRG